MLVKYMRVTIIINAKREIKSGTTYCCSMLWGITAKKQKKKTSRRHQKYSPQFFWGGLGWETKFICPYKSCTLSPSKLQYKEAPFVYKYCKKPSFIPNETLTNVRFILGLVIIIQYKIYILCAKAATCE